MRRLIFALLILPLPVLAGEKTSLGEYLDSLPPMNVMDRAAFDKALRAAYSKECDCVRFVIGRGDGKGRTRGIPLSRLRALNDGDRRLLIEAIRRGIYIPISSNAPPT